MSVESKYTLLAQNQSSFPNNTTGYITPEILREFNIDMIDSLVDELSFQAYSGSVYNQIVAVSSSINSSVSSSVAALSQSAATSFSASVASQLALSTSVDSRLDNLEAFSSSLDATFATDAQLAAVSAALDSSKVNNSQTSSMAVSSSTYAVTSSFALTASFALNAGGINTGSLVTTSSFNSLTQSFNNYTQSTDTKISNLNTISASYLSFTQSYYSDSASFDSRIDGLAVGLGLLTTGSSLTDTQYISGSLVFTGSARVSISTASIYNYGSGQQFLQFQYNPSASALTYNEVNTNLPQYLNQAVKVGMVATGSLVGGLVKVYVNPSQTGSSVDGSTTNEGGLLFASQSTTDWRYVFGYNGNPESDGGKAFVVQRGLHKLAGNATSIPIIDLPNYPIGSPIYWDGQAQGACTLVRPTNGIVLRLGYIAAIENGANPYVREIWYDPIWEEGETLYNLRLSGSVSLTNSNLATTGSNTFIGNETFQDAAGNASTLTPTSGSLMLVAKTYTSASAHLTASAGTFVNLIFKNNNNTPDTIISGSNNIFTNPAAATSGFKRFMTTGNIIGSTNAPQISGSMAFPITMSQNTINGQGTITLRGPVSSSTWTLSNNLIPNAGGIVVGSSAANNAEKLIAGANISSNILGQQLSIIANKAPLSQSLSIQANTFGLGTTTVNANSSSFTFSSNIMGGVTINNNSEPVTSLAASNGNQATVSSNLIGGNSNTITFSGSATGNGALANNKTLAYNQVLGYGNQIGLVATGLNEVTGAAQLNATMIAGNQLIITGSDTGVAGTNVPNVAGGAHFGRFNANDSIRNASGQTVFSVGTGTSTSNRKTGFYIDSGSNTFVEGTFNLSGSGNTTGSFDVSGSFTSSLEMGKFYVGNESGRTATVATSSYVSNTTDTYTSTPAVQQIVTLTQSEWNSISGSSNSNTLYIIM